MLPRRSVWWHSPWPWLRAAGRMAMQPSAILRPPSARQAVMTVTATPLERVELTRTIAMTGSVYAWQDVIIASEVGGYRVADVFVDVGDRVKKGQRLVVLSTALLASGSRDQASDAEAARSRARERAGGARARPVPGNDEPAVESGSRSADLGANGVAVAVRVRARRPRYVAPAARVHGRDGARRRRHHVAHRDRRPDRAGRQRDAALAA